MSEKKEKKRLFRKEYYDKDRTPENIVKKNKFINMVMIHVLFKRYITKVVLILNTLILMFMVGNLNIGIILFLANQYIVLLYYLHIRKKKGVDNDQETGK